MKITIVVPAFNSMKYIEDCMNSVLNQTYENYDIHAYDNESTDETYEYLLELEKNHDNLKVAQLSNIHPNSYREAFDAGFENSDADYITFVSTDDYLEPDYIANCMRILAHDPDRIKCMQSGIIGVQNGNRVNQQIHKYKSMHEFKIQCMTRSPVNTPTVVYQRSLYPLIVESREAHKEADLLDAGAGDYDMWCGLAERGVFIYPVSKCLGYYYRWHSEQCTWRVHQYTTNYDEIVRTYWKKKWTL
jgi:glycosyltransferase involved in cell wall biosynthesis